MKAGADAWWDKTWNPAGGCEPVSPGCKNCYAPKQAGTLHQQAGAKQRVIPLYDGVTDLVNSKHVFNGKLTVAPPGHDTWSWPLDWPGAPLPKLGPGMPSLIFVVSMADLFHERRPTTIIDEVVGTITASNHIGQLLTRRADVMAAYFRAEQSLSTLRRRQKKLWLGFSAERQQEFDLRWKHIAPLASAGWTVFVSIAPMLESVTLPDDFLAYGDRVWVIVSGEQGRGWRKMAPAWARAVKNQCAEAGVRFFMKQMAGKKLIPPDLEIRQFPAWPGAAGGMS
jgi:protein gp37